MPNLYDAETGARVGKISEAQLDFLIRQLVEEDLDDQSYYIDRATLDWFETHDADVALMDMLRATMGDRDGMEIVWRED